MANTVVNIAGNYCVMQVHIQWYVLSTNALLMPNESQTYLKGAERKKCRKRSHFSPVRKVIT
jgi:hypothetical protein